MIDNGVSALGEPSSSDTNENGDPSFNAIVIGTGVAGLYQIYRLKRAGMRVLALEAGADVGGVWYWNRYPGARLDSESYTYAYSFSKELLEEWNWSEHFAGREELHRYFRYVAERFGLLGHIRFDSRVIAAHYSEEDTLWTVETEAGDRFSCRYLIAAVGPLTSPTFPAIEGRNSFAGRTCHTSRWHEDPVSFVGKRVAVIGTGATGVQVTQEAAKTAEQLYVFQRTPNYCAPLNNAKIAAEELAELKSRYFEIIARCRATDGWFIHDTDPRRVLELAQGEREDALNALYDAKGLGIWMGNFADVATNPEANRIVSHFMRNKIRQRVKNPAVAEKLVPKTYGFGLRRVPLETGYYEAFNQPNVTLIDLNETPIERITTTSIVTSGAEIDVDIIVYATGFDAITGSFDRIDIRGEGGARLREKWADGPVTFLGVHTAGFPNLFMPGGPLASGGNFTPALEYSVDWIMDLLQFMKHRGFETVDVKPEAEQEFTREAAAIQNQLLVKGVTSWFTGVNTNVEGRDKPRVVLYLGGAKSYREKCSTVKSANYKQLDFH